MNRALFYLLFQQKANNDVFICQHNNVLSIKNGEWESVREKDMKKTPSRNKLMNKWLTGILKRCRLPQDIDMESKKHVLGGARC